MAENTPPAPIATNLEEAVTFMSARASIDGDDWRVKIQRRSSQASPQETVAILHGASASQLLSPEPWLAKLAGGSPYYTFRVVHEKDQASDRPTAIYSLPAIRGEPATANPRVVNGPNWNGPTTIVYPTDEAQPARNGAIKWPAAPDSTGAPRQPAATTADGGGGPSTMLVELQRERERLSDERHRMEMDAVRRESDTARKAVESQVSTLAAEIRSLRERPIVHEPKTDPMEMVAKVIAAVGAALAPVIPLVVASREANSKAEAARLEREANREMKREERESALMEKLATQSAEQAKVIGVFTESLGTVARSMVQTVAMVGELRQPEPQDDGIMGVVKTAIGAWAEVASRGGGSPFAPPPLPAAQTAAPPAQPPRAPVPGAPVAAPTIFPVEEREVVDISPGQMLDMVADAIRQRETENDLANDIVEALGAPDFVQGVVAEGGVVPAMRKRLGDEWAADQTNRDYLTRLFSAVGQAATAKGVSVAPLFPPEAA